MIVLYPAVVLAAAVIVWRGTRSRGDARRRGWRWFAAWAAAGAAITFSFLTGLSIGLFVLPAAAALLLWVARAAPRLAEAIGFVAGLGSMLVLVGLLNRDYTPCPAGGLSLPAGSPPGSSVSCGGLDPMPWLIAGLVVSAVAVVGYAAIRAAHDVSA
jgi:hypothetical protein